MLSSICQLHCSDIAQKCDLLLGHSKQFFDRAFRHLDPAGLGVNQLFVENFDLEQIYEQVNLACQKKVVADPLPDKLCNQFEQHFEKSAAEPGDNDSVGEVPSAGKQPKKVTWEDQKDKGDKIKKIEEQILKSATEKPWHMLGEAIASERPDNCLLEPQLAVDFERRARHPPAITPEYTNRIEEMTKQRIKDNAFDDVERKRMLFTDQAKRTELVNDPALFRKSEQGLADHYENAFTQLSSTRNEGQVVDAKLKTELIDGMKTLMARLDALSHNTFVPRLSESTETINRGLRSVRIETTAGNDADETVPGRVHPAPHELKGSDEMSKTDKKRLRRIRLKQVKIDKMRRKKLEDLKPKSEKRLKSLEERETVKKVEKLIKNTPTMRVAKKHQHGDNKKAKKKKGSQ